MFPNDSDFETKVTIESAGSAPIEEDTPFRILFIGDWSGLENPSADSKLVDVRPIEIDRDNFDEVIERLQVGLDLDFQGSGENVLSLKFSKLDDFHPDYIFQRLPLFENLRNVRQKLLDKNTFNEAANEVRSWLSNEEFQDSSSNKETTVYPSETNDSQTINILDQILDKTDDSSLADLGANVGNTELSKFVSQLVKPHLIQTDAAEQSNLLMIVDEVISDLMRQILQHPQFKTLESAWRGLHFLVTRIETNAHLKIDLLNISKKTLIDDLKTVSDLKKSSLLKIVNTGMTGITGAESWAVICGSYTFSLDVEDVAALIRIAKIGEEANTPFISHIEPEMFGIKNFNTKNYSEEFRFVPDSREGKLWTALRSMPESKYLGLVLPRFLGRLPYGEKTDPTEHFYFEEFSDVSQHEDYLWLNPTFACALLLAQTYSEFGWEISKNLFLDIENLPVHFYRENNENKTKPCAEISLSVKDCEQILNQGLTPLISFINTDRIRLGRLQYIAEPFSFLQGKWN
jgi:type VI secretion system protein ImpC